MRCETQSERRGERRAKSTRERTGEVSRLLRSAAAHHRAGRLEPARSGYARVLMLDPANADALHLTGLLAEARGEHEAARDWISRAIERSPNTALFHVHLGLVLDRMGEPSQALLAFCQAVELEPRNPHLLIQLGRALESRGCEEDAATAYAEAVKLDPSIPEPRLLLGSLAQRCGEDETAEVWYRSVLRVAPGDGEASLALGILLLARGRLREALVHCKDATRVLPQRAATWLELGNAEHLAGHWNEASACYRRALELEPSHAAAQYNQAVNSLRAGELDKAREGFRRTLELEPGHAGALHNLATLAQLEGRQEEAILGYGAALNRMPDFLEARYNLASVLQAQDRLEEAEKHYRAILGADANHAAALNNLGNTLLAMCRPEESRRCFERARQVYRERGDLTASEYREACFNLGVTQLLQGDYESGWAGYDSRLGEANSAAARFTAPLWNGEPYDGETLLVHAEQGMGDTVQFARYLRMAKHRGGALVFECHADLVPLMRQLIGPDRVIARGEELPAFERHTPLMSLPRIFGTTLDSIPGKVPYLAADPDRVSYWRSRLSVPGRRSVGLVWAGNPRHKNDRNRSLRGGELARLRGVEGLHLVSLQKGERIQDTARGIPAGEIMDLQDDLHDVAETAAVVSALDLVISVDTMVAHLAGALARPVWVLLAYAPDWRWMLDRADSPWYPTMRLFRQSRRGDWSEPLDAVRHELRNAW